jgi:hypothetical protein
MDGRNPLNNRLNSLELTGRKPWTRAEPCKCARA